MSGSYGALHHWRLDPFSRQARIAAAEKGLKLRLREERVWDGRQDFLALNPAGETPVLVVGEGAGRAVIIGARALLEYFEDVRPDPPLLPGGPAERAEARRLADWFDRKFNAEVNAALLFELVERRMTRQGAPDDARVAAGRKALDAHLTYIDQLADDDGPWLAGAAFSVADVAALAHVSCMAELGEVDWTRHASAQRWWDRAGERPSADVWRAPAAMALG